MTAIYVTIFSFHYHTCSNIEVQYYIIIWSQKFRSSSLILRYVVLSYHITIYKFRRNYTIHSKTNAYYYTWICRQCIQKKTLLFSKEVLVFSSLYIFSSKCKVLAWPTQSLMTPRYSRVILWFDFHEQKPVEKNTKQINKHIMMLTAACSSPYP